MYLKSLDYFKEYLQLYLYDIITHSYYYNQCKPATAAVSIRDAESQIALHPSPVPVPIPIPIAILNPNPNRIEWL